LEQNFSKWMELTMKVDDLTSKLAKPDDLTMEVEDLPSKIAPTDGSH